MSCYYGDLFYNYGNCDFNYNLTAVVCKVSCPQVAMDKNLHNFIKVVEKNPLFAAEGLDLENARFSLQELVDSLHDIKKSWKNIIAKMFFFKYPLEETVHPISFLKSFLKSEEMRREFQKSPNYENARMLLRIWRETLEEYVQGVKSYQSALLAIQKLEYIEDNSKMEYFDIAPTFLDFMNWTDLFLENSRRLKLELNDCSLVLAGQRVPMVYETRRKRNNFAHRGDSLKVSLPPISDHLRQLVEIVQSKFIIEEKYESLIYSLGHFNEGRITPRRFNVLLARVKDVKPKLLMVILADDLYFLNFKKGHFLDFSIYRPLIERNLDYWCQPSTTFYSNLDISYQADLATIVDLKRRDFKNLDLVKKQKSSLLDLLFGTGVYYNHRFAKLLRIFSYHKNLPKISFLYLARSYPSLYFLPFNESVWRLNKKPFISGTRFGTNSSYETFHNLIKKVPFETLKEVVKISVNRLRYFKEELNRD